MAATKFAGEHAAFLYGTLMAPGILFRVIYGRRDPEVWQQSTSFKPAILEGYERHRVQGAHYPAIVAREGARVRGSVCTGLTEGDIWRLDVYEGDEYERVKVKVKILKDDVGLAEPTPLDGKLSDHVEEEKEVDVYLWKDSERDRLEEGEWDFEEFKATRMKKWTGEETVVDGEITDPYFDQDQLAEPMKEAERVISRRKSEAQGDRPSDFLVATDLDRL